MSAFLQINIKNERCREIYCTGKSKRQPERQIGCKSCDIWGAQVFLSAFWYVRSSPRALLYCLRRSIHVGRDAASNPLQRWRNLFVHQYCQCQFSSSLTLCLSLSNSPYKRIGKTSVRTPVPQELSVKGKLLWVFYGRCGFLIFHKRMFFTLILIG